MTRMAGKRTERRLAAILAIDVVGYSRMMGADEAGTLAALKAVRAGVFEPAIAALPEIDDSDEDAVKTREAEIKRRDDLLAKRFDAANEEKFLFGEKWNQQVRAYNDRRAEQKSQ